MRIAESEGGAGAWDRDVYGSVWHTSGATLWGTMHNHTDQTGCSLSNIKTYLTD
jgi:hypothetical protein